MRASRVTSGAPSSRAVAISSRSAGSPMQVARQERRLDARRPVPAVSGSTPGLPQQRLRTTALRRSAGSVTLDAARDRKQPDLPMPTPGTPTRRPAVAASPDELRGSRRHRSSVDHPDHRACVSSSTTWRFSDAAAKLRLGDVLQDGLGQVDAGGMTTEPFMQPKRSGTSRLAWRQLGDRLAAAGDHHLAVAMRLEILEQAEAFGFELGGADLEDLLSHHPCSGSRSPKRSSQMTISSLASARSSG